MATPSSRGFVFAVRGPITRADLPGLTARLCALLARTELGSVTGAIAPSTLPSPGCNRDGAVPCDVVHCDVVHCDVADVNADAPTVEALARLHLAAKKYGCQVRLRHASAELMELVAFMGLGEVLIE